MMRRPHRAITVGLALAAMACTKEGAPDPTGQVARDGRPCGDAAAAPKVTSPAIGELLAGVPGDAVAIGFLDLPTPPWEAMTSGFGVPLAAEEKAALDRELKAYLGRTLQLDVSRVQFAVGFVAGPPMRGGVLLKSVSGEALVKGGETYKGATLKQIDARVTVALRGDVVAVGPLDAVHAMIDTLAGETPSVIKAQPALVEWLASQSAGAFYAGAMRPTPALSPPPPYAGLAHLAFALGSNKVQLALEGDDASLAAVQTLAETFLSRFLDGTEEAHQAAVAGPNEAEAVGAILAAHYVRSLAKRARPVRDGKRLIVELAFDLSGSGSLMTALGVGAAVAVPAFKQYVERARGAAPAVTPPPLAP